MLSRHEPAETLSNRAKNMDTPTEPYLKDQVYLIIDSVGIAWFRGGSGNGRESYGQAMAPVLMVTPSPGVQDHAIPLAGAVPTEPNATLLAVGLMPTRHRTPPWPTVIDPLFALADWICRVLAICFPSALTHENKA
jgi:hypothetical protein